MKRLLAKISFLILICFSVVMFGTLLLHIINRADVILDICLFCFFLLLLVLNFVILYPVIFDIEENERPGLFPFINNQSDILLFISLEAIKNKIDARSFDYSLSWINFLNKECGFFSIVDFKNREAINYKEKRVIIVTSSVLESIRQKDIDLLKNFVSAGGLLCIELSDQKLSSLTGYIPTGKFCPVSRITKVNGPLHFAEALQAMPLFFKLQELEHLDKNVEVMLSIDDKPAICKKRLNKGAVISILFDFGRQSTVLKQGFSCLSAADRKNRRNKFLEMQDVITDIISDNRLSDNDLPFADILEAFIFNIISSSSLYASWWYYPRMSKAAVLITHDEDYYADRCLMVSEYERRLNINSTFFVISDSTISASTLEAMQRNGTEIGIHWNRFLLHVSGTGLHKNRFRTLDQQLARLRNHARGGKLRVNRIHWLKIDDDALRPFRMLAACGIQADSSFGPRSREKGYIFGTGFPYYLLDKNGGIINMLEFPFHVQDCRNKASGSYLESLLKASITKWHTSIVVLYHPHHFGRHNRVWKNWDLFLTLVKDRDIWQVNFEDYLSFWEERRQSLLKTLFDGQNKVLSIDAEAKGKKVIRIPLTSGRLKLKAIFSNSRCIEFDRIDGYALFPVSEGHYTFNARYEESRM